MWNNIKQCLKLNEPSQQEIMQLMIKEEEEELKWKPLPELEEEKNKKKLYFHKILLHVVVILAFV